MSPQLSTSAALRFTEEELGGPCLENESVFSVTGTPVIICQGNGDRVGLLIMNLGSAVINVALTGIPSVSNGFILQPNGGVVSLTVRDDFTLPSRQFSAASQAGAVNVYVLEIIRFTSIGLNLP